MMLHKLLNPSKNHNLILIKKLVKLRKMKLEIDVVVLNIIYFKINLEPKLNKVLLVIKVKIQICKIHKIFNYLVFYLKVQLKLVRIQVFKKNNLHLIHQKIFLKKIMFVKVLLKKYLISQMKKMPAINLNSKN